jgi:hypothetical protein
MGFSRGLILVALAILVWSFQPYFLDDHVLALKNLAGEPMFVVLRYFFATALFGVLLFAGRLRRRPRSFAGVKPERSHNKTRWLVYALVMGGLMYFSRLFELLSYGPHNEFAAFGMVFSIFFVLLWDWKGWVVSWARVRLSQSRTGALYNVAGIFSRTLSSEAELLSWAVQAVLVFVAGLFFLSAESGSLPFSASDATGAHGSRQLGYSLLWVFASSLCLSLFYDLMIVAGSDENDETSKVRRTAKIHALVGLTACICAVPHLLLSAPGLRQSAATAFAVITHWDLAANLKYFAGYVVGVTCVGYLFENLGLNFHDTNHRFGSWRITGREWASITATLDPLLSVAVVVPFFRAAGEAKEPIWFAVAALAIAAVTLQAFLLLWSAKKEIMRSRAVFIMSARTSSVPDCDRVVLTWLSRLALFRAESVSSMEVVAAQEYLGEREHESLRTVLLRSRRFVHTGNLSVTILSLRRGRLLFGRGDAEGYALWQMYVRWLVAGTQSQIVELSDVIHVAAGDAQWSASARETPISMLARKLQEIGDDTAADLMAVCVSGPAVPERPVTERGVERTRKLACFAQRNTNRNIDSDLDNLWSMLLSTSEHGRLSAVRRISAYDGGGFAMSIEGVQLVECLPEEWSGDGYDDVLVEGSLLLSLIRSGERLPAWVPLLPSDCRNVVIWSRSDVDLTLIRALSGSADGRVEALPAIANVTSVDESKIGGAAFIRAIKMAAARSRLRLEVIVVTDDEHFDDDMTKYVHFSAVGVAVEITYPKSRSALEDAYRRRRFPLVFFVPTLDKWEEAADAQRTMDALPLMQPYFDRCDPYMIERTSVAFGADKGWPLRRSVRCNLEDVSAVVAGHLGLSPTVGPCSTFVNASAVVENLQSEFDLLNVEIETGRYRRHCYGLFEALGALGE